MQITNTPYANHTELVQRNTLMDTNKSTALDQPNKVETDSVSISNAGRNAEAKWQEISQKYNVTNISGNEVISMAQDLYSNKLISTDEYLSMFVPQSIDDDLSAKRDYLRNMSLDLDMQIKYGNSKEGIQSTKDVINILKKIG